jgi:uncharacterized protein YidB (DUF937 family)
MPMLAEQNVFDMMVPTAPEGASDEDVIRSDLPLVATFLALLAQHEGEGELFGLVEMFESKKQLDKLHSWISRRHNRPVSADEVRTILGQPFLDQLRDRMLTAGQLKIEDAEKLPARIATVFPAVVRVFARTGQIPPRRILNRCLVDFQQNFGLTPG